MFCHEVIDFTYEGSFHKGRIIDDYGSKKNSHAEGCGDYDASPPA